MIPPDSTGMTRFRQESQGHDKDLHDPSAPYRTTVVDYDDVVEQWSVNGLHL